MQTRNIGEGRLVLAGFVVSVLVALALSLAAPQFYQRHIQATESVDQSRQVLDGLGDIRINLAASEAGVRGYVVTGKDSYLDTYTAALQELPRRLQAMRAMVTDNSRQRQRIEDLEKAVGLRLASARQIIDTRRTQGLDAARDLLESDAVNQQIDHLRSIRREFEQEELSLLESRQAEQAAAATTFWWAIAALILVQVVSLIVLYVLIRRRLAIDSAARTAEERHRLLVESVQDYAIIILDDKGKVVSWGVGAERMKGYRAEEIIGQHFSLFYPREDIDSGKPLRELDEAASTGRCEDDGWRLRKDGSRFWAHVTITAIRGQDGVLRGFGKVTQDLTERKQFDEALQNEIKERSATEKELKQLTQALEGRVAERAELQADTNRMLEAETTERKRAEAEMREAQERFGSIIESAMDAIITVDEDQRIVLFNSAAEAAFGCPKAQAIGAPLEWFIPKRFRDGHAAHVRRFGETGVTSRRMGAQRIVTALRQNQEEFPIEASISQVKQHGKTFFTVILRDVTERLRAEEKVRESREELIELASTAQAAREQEKGRIARELHDEMGQLLTALKMDLGALKTSHGQQDYDARVASAETLTNTIVAAVRKTAADLRPTMLDDLGLIPAVEWLVQSFRQRSGIECTLSVEPPELELGEPHATAVYRIIQESLTNTAKHAKAAFVDVAIVRTGDELLVTIRDNGRGFNTSEPRKTMSFGLVGLRERVYFLDGRVDIESTPGRGTTVQARIPLRRPA